MKKYIGKRIMISLVTLLIIILVLFMLLQLMPGSPFNDEKLTADQIAMMSKKYGLDKPLIVQFFTYVKNLLQGDFGVSYVISKDTSISVLLKNRVPVSFGIGLEAVSFGAVVGLILGILAALKKNSWLDTICTVISVLGVSLPSYVFALVMAYFIGYKAQWLPLLRIVDHADAGAVDVYGSDGGSIYENLPSGGAGQRLHAACGEQGNHGTPASGAPCTSKRADPDHYGTGAVGCRSDDWFPGYREDLLDSGHRKLNDCSDSVQRLQRDDFAGIYLQCHVHCPDAGG